MSTDLRKYARQTNIRLLIGFVFLLLLIGDGFIYLLYGKAAAISGLLCMLAGLFPLVLIYFALYLLDLIAKRAKDD